MQKNADLAYRALDYIREHPETWSQISYFCGTSMCYGGTVLFLAEGITSYREAIEHGERPGYRAQRLLGWSGAEGTYVFSAMTRDFGELERIVKEVLNGEIS